MDKLNRNTYIANRIEEVLLNGKWIANTNYSECITSVDRNQATHKVGNLNTIAALTFHINYYLSGLLQAFHSGVLSISDTYSFDLREIQSDAQWHELVDSFHKNARDFVEFVRTMDNALFDAPFIDAKYGSYLRNIEGVIEHSYYHLGQIFLLIKLTGDPKHWVEM